MYWSDAGAADGRMSRCPKCETAARKQQAEAKARGELAGKPDRNGRIVAFSEEERQRRSLRAKQLHEKGLLGGAMNGAKGGRGVRRHRVTDAVLEHFRQPEKQELVINAFESALKGNSKALRLRAAESVMKVDEKSAAQERINGADLASMHEDDLKELVMQGIEAMIERGELPVDIELGGDDVREIP
jgi:hypothetical protein